MPVRTTLDKIKEHLRIKHTALDDDLTDEISSCLADLTMCGIEANEEDPLILAALKLWCRASTTQDTNKAAAYKARYNDLKGSLQLSSDYKAEG